MQRLRVEFDSGADFDMSECGPGEIDPHAVASIFKAYLRECESRMSLHIRVYDVLMKFFAFVSARAYPHAPPYTLL